MVASYLALNGVRTRFDHLLDLCVELVPICHRILGAQEAGERLRCGVLHPAIGAVAQVAHEAAHRRVEQVVGLECCVQPSARQASRVPNARLMQMIERARIGGDIENHTYSCVRVCVCACVCVCVCMCVCVCGGACAYRRVIKHA